LQERTKTALIMNTIVGVPVIVALSVFTSVVSISSPAIRGLSTACLGYAVSLIFVYLSLRLLKLKKGEQ
jgi:hypothetical protein